MWPPQCYTGLTPWSDLFQPHCLSFVAHGSATWVISSLMCVRVSSNKKGLDYLAMDHGMFCALLSIFFILIFWFWLLCASARRIWVLLRVLKLMIMLLWSSFLVCLLMAKDKLLLILLNRRFSLLYIVSVSVS